MISRFMSLILIIFFVAKDMTDESMYATLRWNLTKKEVFFLVALFALLHFWFIINRQLVLFYNNFGHNKYQSFTTKAILIFRDLLVYKFPFDTLLMVSCLNSREIQLKSYYYVFFLGVATWLHRTLSLEFFHPKALNKIYSNQSLYILNALIVDCTYT